MVRSDRVAYLVGSLARRSSLLRQQYSPDHDVYRSIPKWSYRGLATARGCNQARVAGSSFSRNVYNKKWLPPLGASTKSNILWARSIHHGSYYDILGVSKNATQSDITKSYDQLAWKLEPACNKDDADAIRKFERVSEAYQVLKDEAKRAQYDRSSSENKKKNDGGDHKGSSSSSSSENKKKKNDGDAKGSAMRWAQLTLGVLDELGGGFLLPDCCCHILF